MADRPPLTASAATPAALPLLRRRPGVGGLAGAGALAAAGGVLALGAALPWQAAAVAVLAALVAMASAGLAGQARAADRPALARLAAAQALWLLVLAAVHGADALDLQWPGRGLTDRQWGLLGGLALAALCALALALRPPARWTAALPELLAWPGALLCAAGTVLSGAGNYPSPGDAAAAQAVALRELLLGAAGLWGLLYAGLAAWLHRRGLAPRPLRWLAGLALLALWVPALQAVGSGGLAAMVAAALPLLGLAALAVLTLRRAPGDVAAEVVALALLSLAPAWLVVLAAAQQDQEAWLVAALPVLLGPCGWRLWRDLRAPQRPWREGGGVGLLVAPLLGLVLAGALAASALDRWTGDDGLPLLDSRLGLPAVGVLVLGLLAAYAVWRGSRLSGPAVLGLLGLWWPGSLLLVGGLSGSPLADPARQGAWAVPVAVWAVLGLPAAGLAAWAWRRRLPWRCWADALRRRDWALALSWVPALGGVLLAAVAASPQTDHPVLVQAWHAWVPTAQPAARQVGLHLHQHYLWAPGLPVAASADAATALAQGRDPADRISRLDAPVDLASLRRLAVTRPAAAASAAWAPVPGDRLHAGRRVGYWPLTERDDEEIRRLDATRARFYKADVDALVLDLRGSRLESARQAQALAQALLAVPPGGLDFLVLARGPGQSPPTTTLRLLPADSDDAPVPLRGSKPLGLTRLVVLIGPGTCGAAELLVHGLRPHVRLHLVGAASCGAPVDAQRWPLPGGGELLLASARARWPAAAGPLQPDCAAAPATAGRAGPGDDGADRPWQEPAMRHALHLIAHGRCAGPG